MISTRTFYQVATDGTTVHVSETTRKPYDGTVVRTDGICLTDAEGNQFYRILTFSATGAHGWRRNYLMQNNDDGTSESWEQYRRRTRVIPQSVRDNY